MRLSPVMLSSYFSKLIKAYAELHQTYQAAFYRITDIQFDTNYEPMITAQIIGKASIFKMAPNEIVVNDELINGFSKRDIRTITYLATKENHQQDNYKIITQEMCDLTNTILYKMKSLKNEDIVSKTAHEILCDKELIGKLKAEDAINIGYTAGMQNMLNELSDLSKLKNNN